MASLFVAARFYSFERSTDDSSYVMAGALELCPRRKGRAERLWLVYLSVEFVVMDARFWEGRAGREMGV